MEKQEFKITVEVVDGQLEASIDTTGFNALELIGIGTVINQVYEDFIDKELKEQ